jgi:hypothetical protein
MKIREIITEAKMDPGIRKELTAKGYRFLDKGQDQDVYLAPNGTILKIFGTDVDSTPDQSSLGQRSFIDFATYCMKNPDNPFLPQFGGFEKFEFNGKYYLQISCERLFDFDKHNLEDVANEIESFVQIIVRQGWQAGIKRYFEYNLDDKWAHDEDLEITGKFLTLLGDENNLAKFAKAIEDLHKIAKLRGYRFDLHPGNFMLGSDGEIVINDPFFTGTYRDF